MLKIDKLDKEVEEFVNDCGKSICKRAGLAGMMNSFYCGLDIRPSEASEDEIANDLELSKQEFEYWENLFYKKDSWLNQESIANK